jgi:hypothetical protein
MTKGSQVGNVGVEGTSPVLTKQRPSTDSDIDGHSPSAGCCYHPRVMAAPYVRARHAVAAMIVGCLVMLAGAQSFGELSGTVRDGGGGALPDVIVTVSGPGLDKPRITTTDIEGRYTIAKLPSGKKYVVTFSLTCFGTVRRKNVSVRTSSNKPMSVSLRLDHSCPFEVLGPRDRFRAEPAAVTAQATNLTEVIAMEATTTNGWN